MSTRRERAIKRRGWVESANRKNGLVRRCPRCGQAGPHFVPPSFGDIGFFTCDPPADIRNHTREPRCRAWPDGECSWIDCPQLRDGEPKATGRHCPIDNDPEETS